MKDLRTPVPIECLERDYGISLGDIFWAAERHYFQNMCSGVVMPQHQQLQQEVPQQEARAPAPVIVTKLKTWDRLPSDTGYLVERFMQCRPGTGYGIPADDPRMVEYVGACNAFTQSLADTGRRDLRVI